MENSAVITCSNSKDENMYTVVIKYRVYRNDRGKLFGRLLVLKRKVENFLKEFVDDEILFQNPVLQRTKDGLLDLFQGLTSLCSGISPSPEMLTIPELPLLEVDSPEKYYEMKFVKGTSLTDMWLCYVDNGEFVNLLERLRDKYDNDELEPFILYPRLGEHVYFKQGDNIFRGIVQEYTIPENCEDEESVDVKVLNMDNSDVITLPQNCFFQLDKEGITLPMQCVLCTMEDANNLAQNDTEVSQNLSFPMMKNHKLTVLYHRKKLTVAGSPFGAQSVSVSVPNSNNRLKDENNGFNVNSKEFIPRNNNKINTHAEANSIPDGDSKSGQSTRSTSPNHVSSQEESKEKPVEKVISDLSIRENEDSNNAAENTANKKNNLTPCPVVVGENTKSNKNNGKDKVESKVVNPPNYPNKSAADQQPLPPVTSNIKPNTNRTTYEKERNIYAGKDYRHNVPKLVDNKVNKSIPDKFKNNPARMSSPNNEIRNKSTCTPSTSSHPPQTQSPASLPPNAQVPPYLFQSVPQFPPGPIHFSGQYVPLPAPQHLNSAAATAAVPFHFPQYPYAAATPAYLSTAAPSPTTHSQYHMPPVSSPYQSYMQPVAMAPFFSQPPFSQQFYQPSHLQPTWSHLQPSFHVSGSPQQAITSHNTNVGGTVVNKNPAMGKSDYNSSSSVSNFKYSLYRE